MSANAAMRLNNVEATENLLDRYEEALDNIAMAATAKQNTLETLVNTNEHLVQENTRLTAEVARLNKIIANLPTSQNRRGKSYAELAPEEKSNNEKKSWPEWCDPDAYCWSCGYKLRVGHNSKTCKRKKEGHKEDATRKNIMGGSAHNKSWGNQPNGK